MSLAGQLFITQLLKNIMGIIGCGAAALADDDLKPGYLFMQKGDKLSNQLHRRRNGWGQILYQIRFNQDGFTAFNHTFFKMSRHTEGADTFRPGGETVAKNKTLCCHCHFLHAKACNI